MDRDHRTKANRRKTWHAGHIVVMISPSASRTSCQANGIPCSFFVFFSLFFCFFFFFRFLFIITTNYGFNSGPSDRTSTCFTDTLSTALPLVGKPEKSEWMNRQRTNKQRETRSQSLIRSVTSPTGCIFLPSIFLFSLLSLFLSVSLSFFFPVSFFFFFLLIHQSVDIPFPSVLYRAWMFVTDLPSVQAFRRKIFPSIRKVAPSDFKSMPDASFDFCRCSNTRECSLNCPSL